MKGDGLLPFVLAETLAMTVAELEARMSQAEMRRWWLYLSWKAQRREMMAP